MEKEKYYIPKLEDFRVGYEYVKRTNQGWEPGVIARANDLHHIIRMYQQPYMEGTAIRTPYLTKEQIEGEGWVTGYPYSNRPYTKKGLRVDGVEQVFELNYNFETHVLDISYDGGEYYNFDVFVGKCPSINEFRTVCKLLEI